MADASLNSYLPFDTLEEELATIRKRFQFGWKDCLWCLFVWAILSIGFPGAIILMVQ